MNLEECFVEWCYKNILGRKPDDRGLDHYKGILSKKVAFRQVIFDILDSNECALNMVKDERLRSLIAPYINCGKSPYGKFKKKIFKFRNKNEIDSFVSLILIGVSFQKEKESISQHIESIESMLWDFNDKISFVSAILEANKKIVENKEHVIFKAINNINFSIVVNTFNRAHTIKATLESLGRLRYEHYEVVIVNGPSTDDTNIILEDYKEVYKIVSCPEANLSMSRNIGIANSAGDVVCFIDDDAVPEPNWLENIAKAYEKDPLLGAVGGFIRDNTGFTYQSKYILCNAFGDSIGFDDYSEAKNHLENNSDYYLSPTGTNCTFRKDILELIGGFDEEYVYFLDETDVVIRMIKKGYHTEIVKGSEIHHKFASSHLRDHRKIPKDIYSSVRSKTYFILTHGYTNKHLLFLLNYFSDYRKSLRRDYDWYYQHDKIDEVQWKFLHNGIDLGIHDGLVDASKLKPKTVNFDYLVGDKIFKRVTSKYTKESLKICFLVDEFPPQLVGGIGNWTHLLAHSLAELGHEVTVITKSVLEYVTVDWESGVFVHRIPIRHFEPKDDIFNLSYLPDTIKDLAYSFYEEVVRVDLLRGVDVVSSPVWDVIGSAVVASNKFKTIISLHTNYKMSLPFKKEWIGEYRRNHVDKILFAEQDILKKCTKIMANSKAIIRDSIQNISGIEEKIYIVPHAVLCKMDNVRHVDSKSDTNILYVGRFEARKGIDLLLQSIPLVLAECSFTYFHLVGRDSEFYKGHSSVREWFINKYKDESWLSRVNFYGEVEYETRDNLYSRCDIFVAPSRYESFGLIYLEAMSYGLPCIALNVGGVPEVVKSGLNGILVDGESAFDLSKAIIHLVTDKDYRSFLSINAINDVSNNYHQAVMATNALAVYKDALRV